MRYYLLNTLLLIFHGFILARCQFSLPCNTLLVLFYAVRQTKPIRWTDLLGDLVPLDKKFGQFRRIPRLVIGPFTPRRRPRLFPFAKVNVPDVGEVLADENYGHILNIYLKDGNFLCFSLYLICSLFIFQGFIFARCQFTLPRNTLLVLLYTVRQTKLIRRTDLLGDLVPLEKQFGQFRRIPRLIVGPLSPRRRPRLSPVAKVYVADVGEVLAGRRLAKQPWGGNSPM
jgi:hypothetical protein